MIAKIEIMFTPGLHNLTPKEEELYFLSIEGIANVKEKIRKEQNKEFPSEPRVQLFARILEFHQRNFDAMDYLFNGGKRI